LARRRTPAAAPRWRGARNQQPTAPAGASPPCAAPDVLLDGASAAESRSRRWRRRARARVCGARGGGRRVLGWGVQGAAHGLNSPDGGSLACGSRTGRRAPVGLGRQRGLGRVQVGDDAAGGMTCGSLPSAAQGAGARAGGGLGRMASWACGAALGCCARWAARPEWLLASWACCSRRG
jgi:hypothetical protein